MASQAQMLRMLTKMLADADAPKGKAKKKAKGKSTVAPADLEDRKAAFSAAAIVAATKAGYTNVIPNETLLTYGKWAEKGMAVKKGEKAIRVKTSGRKGTGLPLFHVSQVEPAEAKAGVSAPAEEASIEG